MKVPFLAGQGAGTAALAKALATMFVMLSLRSELTVNTTGTVPLKMPMKDHMRRPEPMPTEPFLPTKFICVETEQSQPRQLSFMSFFCCAVSSVVLPAKEIMTL